LRWARGVVNWETLECGDMSPFLNREYACALKNAYCYSRGFRQSLAHELAHGPAHWLFEPGLYIITAGTYRKLPHLDTPARLDFFQKSLFQYADEFGWDLRAWAVLANHYHFVAASPTEARTLRRFLGKLHMKTAEQLNLWDNEPAEKSGFNFGTATSHMRARIWRDSITFTKIEWRHGAIPLAENYKWCSAAWFARNAPPAFVKTVQAFKIDQINVPDDF
jgi:putative transposase